MANLSPVEVAKYALEAGFRGQNAAVAVAVSQAENITGSTTARNTNSNGSVDVGLWQINSLNASPDAMTDPLANAQAAYRLASSGRGWANWTNYRNKKYLLFMPTAEASVLAAQARWPGLGLKVAATTPIDRSTLTGSPPSQSGTSVVDTLKAIPEGFNRIGAWISDANNWSRVLYVVLGGALVLVAISNIAKPITQPVTRVAKKAIL